MLHHFAAAHEEGQHERDTENEFKGGPEHGHQTGEEQRAANVLAVRGLKCGDLGFFLSKGADQAGTGEVLLRLRGDVGKHGLDALEAGVDAGPKVLHQDRSEGAAGRKAMSVRCGLMRSMNGSAAAVKTTVFAEYMMAGPSSWRTALRSFVERAMMSPVRLRWKKAGGCASRWAKRSLRRSNSISREAADDDLAGEIEADRRDDGDRKELEGVLPHGGGVDVAAHVVDCSTHEQWNGGFGAVVHNERKATPGKLPPIATQVREERTEAGEHRR